ncbi:MAG: tetratricopeptide repeat protein [Erythrobacter sp.]|nr:tetratricopeptide repeat protein [Erythrobacter sp.]
MKTNRRITTLSLSMAAAAALLTSACSPATEGSLAEATRAYEQGDFAAARDQLAGLFASGGASDQAYLLQLRLMLDLGNGYAALAAIEKLPEAAFDATQRRVATAHAQLLLGKPQEALGLYDGADPARFAEADFRMVLWALRELGEDDEFASGMDLALERHPNSPDLNAMAGEQLIRLGLPDEAAAYAATALKHGPENYEALLINGRVAIAGGDLPRAMQHYAKAAKLYPFQATPHANVAGLQLDLGKVEEAGKTLAGALRDHPEHPFLQWQQARYALAKKDIAAARFALEKARRSFTDNGEFVLLSAQVEEQAGNPVLAVAEYRRYLQMQGSNPDVEARIARLES